MKVKRDVEMKVWSLATVFVFTSCATARVVQSRPEIGGVVAIAPRDNPDARSKGKLLMADICGRKKYRIVEEGETIVGSKTSGSATQSEGSKRMLFSSKRRPTTETEMNAETSNVTEWRLKFVCAKK